MTNTQKFAEQELDILAATVNDSVLIEFKTEILALCEAFGNSGQSGGSAPYVATAISHAIKKLMLQEPICDITGFESEWMIVYDDNPILYQNKRCAPLFRRSDSKCYYLDAIVWKGVEEWDAIVGSVYVDNKDFEIISSRQFVKSFPFKPKTFYIDVIRIPIDETEAKKRKLLFTKNSDNSCYYTVVKTPSQLKKVFRYYDKMSLKEILSKK